MLSLLTFSALALSVEHRLDHTKLGIHDNGDGIVHLTLPGVATSPWIGEDGEPALPVQRTSYALAVKEGSAALRITNAVYEEVALGARQMLAPAEADLQPDGLRPGHQGERIDRPGLRIGQGDAGQQGVEQGRLPRLDRARLDAPERAERRVGGLVGRGHERAC
jgi:hypothetical protein